MDEIGIYATVIITILGIAYPILFQVIAKLDENYSSDIVFDLFKKEPDSIWFLRLLRLSLIAVLIWSLKLEPLFQIDKLNFIINNSASILVILSTTSLVVLFFFFVNKILTYYVLKDFAKYLIKKHNSKKEKRDYFQALNDVFIISIRNNRENVLKTISDFFYKAFKEEREKLNKDNLPIEYPDYYYKLVSNSIIELAILKERRILSLELRTAGEVWLIGELQGYKISEKTFKWMWNNLLLAIRYDNDDMIVSHWETMHQYYQYHMPSISKIYDKTYQKVLNEDKVNEREFEKNRILEFHYALGGLLLYYKRYDCIRRIFNHTITEPPQYVLLPESMDEIFKFYNQIYNLLDSRYQWISSIYPYPKLTGVQADDVIKKCISSYMAILFLRQYAIHSYTSSKNPLDYPTLPNSQIEINAWIDRLEFFKKLIKEQLENKVLLSLLELDFITEEWCAEKDVPYPLDFLNQLYEKLKSKYHQNAMSIKIEDEKKQQLYDSSRNIIENKLNQFMLVCSNSEISGEVDRWYINGLKILQEKYPFTNDHDVEHLNFDSIIADMLSKRISQGVINTFHFKINKTYLLKPENIFKGIDRLHIDDKFVIICIGININYYINHLKVKDLSLTKYKDTNMYNFDGSELVRSAFFILKKSDLPSLQTLEIDSAFKRKYLLKKISYKYNLYASVLDLNLFPIEFLDENRQDKSDDELRKSALVSIIINLEIKWKKNIKMIQINEYSEYINKGLLNELGEIESF